MNKISSKHQAINTISSHSGHNFFLVVPIGLEKYAEKELKDWCSLIAIEFGDQAQLLKTELTKGGVEFSIASQQVAFLLNRCLKIPSRILQRIQNFETRDWLEVEKKLIQVDWKRAFPQGICHWEIAASESKINNEKHLAEFLKKHFENKKYEIKDSGTTAYLRVHNNEFTLSRDLSGEHLHFRGYRIQQGEAPLRENLAAFLWAFMLENSNSILQNQYPHKDLVVIDPFSGSGTLLFEANLWNQQLDFRAYHSDAWLTEDSKLAWERFKARLFIPSYQFYGIDLDRNTVNKAQKNLEHFPLTSIQFYSGNSIEVSTDSNLKPLYDSKSDLWLISNPPYGGQGRLKGVASWKTLWEAALIKYRPSMAVALGPERECQKGMVLSHWECLATQKFLNGGIKVSASFWSKKRLHT